MPSAPYTSIAQVEAGFTAGNLDFASATDQLLALASAGTQAVQIEAGLAIAFCVAHNPRTGNGEGASGGGPFGASLQLPSLLDAQFGGPNGTPNYAWGVLAGLVASSEAMVVSAGEDDIVGYVGTSAGAASTALRALASVFPTASDPYAPAATIARLQTSVPISTGDLAADLAAYAAAGNLPVGTTVDLLARVAILNGSPAAEFATAILDIVTSGAITPVNALDAVEAGAASLASLAPGGGGPGVIKLLLPFADAEPSLVGTIASRIAARVDVADSFVPSDSADAQQAVGFVQSALTSGQITAATAVLMLAAIGTAPGTPFTYTRDPLHVAGDAIYGMTGATITATEAVMAINEAATALGLSPDQTVTLLVGIGGNGAFQLFVGGLESGYVGKEALLAATADAVATLIDTTPSLTAASLGADLTRALLADDRHLVLEVLIRAGFASANIATQEKVGGALAAAAALGSPDLSSVPMSVQAALDAVGDRVHSDALALRPSEGAQAIHVLVGFAEAVSDARSEFLAGREMMRVATDGAVAGGTIVDAVSVATAGGALAAPLATVLLAGIATATNQGGRIPAWGVMADLFASDSASLPALDAVIGPSGALLGVSESLTMLTNVAARATPSVASAVASEIVALVGRDPAVSVHDMVGVLLAAVENAGQSLFGPQLTAAQAALAAAVGQEIVALVAAGHLDAAQAVADLRLAVGNATLGIDHGIQALANLQAAGLDAGAVKAGIQGLIDDHAVSARQAAGDLLALQAAGNAAALQSALTADLEAVLYAQSNLAATAGIGSAAEVRHVADLVATLFATDAPSAQAVLDALAGRIEAGGDLTRAQAARFLVDLYGEGGTAASSALSTIQNLATIQAGQTAPDVGVADIAGQLGTAIGVSIITSSGALLLLEALGSVDGAAARSGIATLILGGQVTVAQLDGEVTAARLTASEAIAILAPVVNAASVALHDAAIAEVESLVAQYPNGAADALQVFLNLANSTSSSQRAIGFGGIEAIASLPNIGIQAFTGLLPLAGSSNPLIAADARAELGSLLADGRLSTAEATGMVSEQLSSAHPVISPAQALDVLAALARAPATQQDIYSYIESVALQHTANPSYGFSRDDAVVAIANSLAGSLADSGPGALAILTLASNGPLAASAVADLVVQAFHLQPAEQAALLAEIGGFANAPNAAFAYGAAISAHNLPLSGLATVIQDDYTHLRVEKAVDVVLGAYFAGEHGVAIAAFDALVAGGSLNGAAIAYWTVQAGVTGQVPLSDAVEALVTIANASASSAIRAAAPGALGDAITGGTTATTGTVAAADVMAGLNSALGRASATSTQILAIAESMLLARIDQVATYHLSDAYAPATAALQGAVSGELTYLLAHGLGRDGAVTTLAREAGYGTTAQHVAAGGLIAGLSGSSLTDEQIATDIVASMQGTGALTAVQAAAMLEAAAVAGGPGLQVEAGKAIGALFTSGALTSQQVFGAILVPLQSNVGTPDQAFELTAGLVLGGGTTAAGAVLNGLEFYIPRATLAGKLADAVAANTLSAAQAVDAAAAMSAANGQAAEAVTVLSTLLSRGLATPADAIAELGHSIGLGVFSPALALDVVLKISAGLSAADEHSAGHGLGELLAHGSVTSGQLKVALGVAVDGGPGVAPIIASEHAISVLVGAAADGSALAAASGVAAIAAAGLAAVVGADAVRMGTALAAVDAAIVAHELTGAAAIPTLAGAAAGAGPSGLALVGAELRHFWEAGFVGVSPTDGQTIVQDGLVAAVQAGLVDGGRAVFLIPLAAHSSAHYGRDGTVIVSLVQGGFVSAANAVAELIAASDAAPETFTPSQLVGTLQNVAFQALSSGQGLALVAAAGAGLATLMVDHPDWDDLLSALEPTWSTVLLAEAIESGIRLQQLGEALYAAILTYSDGLPGSITQGIDSLVSANVLPATHALTILTQVADRGSLDVKIAVSGEIKALLNSHAVSVPEVETALLALVGTAGSSHIINSTGIAILAAMVDPAAPSGPLVSALHDVLAGPLQGQTSFAVGTASAIMADVEPYASQPSHGITAGQAVVALSVMSQFGSGSITHSATARIADLISAGNISAADAFVTVERVLLDGSAGSRLALGAALASLGAALQLDSAGIAHAVVAGIGHGITADEAVRVLASLTGDHDGALHDPFNGLLDSVAIGREIGGLVGHGLTLDAALTDLRASGVVSADDSMRILVGMAATGDSTVQVAAGREAVSIAEGLPQGSLGGYIGSNLSPARQIEFDAGLWTGGSASLRATVVGFASRLATDNHADVTASIDSAVQSGALSVAQASVFLASMAAVDTDFGYQLAAVRSAADDEIAALASGPATPATVVADLATGAAGGSARLLVETGGRIAALTATGLISAADAAQIIEAAALSDPEIVSLLGGATASGLGSGWVQAAAAWIGAGLDSARLAVSPTLANIESAALSYRGVDAGLAFHPGNLADATSLLVELGRHPSTGLQAAAGRAIGDFVSTGGFDPTVAVATVDAALGAPGGLTLQQAETIFFNMVATGGAQTSVAVSHELDALVGRHLETVAGIVAAAHGAVADGALTPSIQIRLLAHLAATDGSFTGPASNEIAAEIVSHAISAADALAILADAAGVAGGAKAVADVMVALTGAGLVGRADAVAAIHTAAIIGHTISLDTAAAALPSLAAGASTAIIHAVAAEFGALVGAGLAPEAAANPIASAVGAGTLSPDAAVQLAAFASAAPGASASGTALDAALGFTVADLVSSGQLPLSQALADIGAAAASGDVGVHATVGLLAGMAGAHPGDHASIATALSGLISTGGITVPQVFADVVAMTTSISDLRGRLQLPTQSGFLVPLLVDLGLMADVARQIAVGHELGNLVAAGTLDGNVVVGQLVQAQTAGADQAQVEMIELAAAGTGGGVMQTGAGIHIGGYDLLRISGQSDPLFAVMNNAVANGALTSAQLVPILITAAQQSPDYGFPLDQRIGAIGMELGTIHAGNAGALALHDSVTQHRLTAVQAVSGLLGLGKDEGASGPDFLAARDQLLALVHEGQITASQVFEKARVSGWVSPAQLDQLRAGLLPGADNATVLALTADIAARESHHGPLTDPFFNDPGMRAEAALDYLRIKAGTLTLDAAIADIKAYGPAHDVSVYSGLKGLSSLLGQDGLPHQAIEDTVHTDVITGRFEAELAHRVAEGFRINYLPGVNGPAAEVLVPDPNQANAISQRAAETLLAGEVSGGTFGRDMLTNDVQAELDAKKFFFNVGTTRDWVQYGGYAYDQALADLIERLSTDHAPSYQIDAARSALATRLYSGASATALINGLLNGDAVSSFDLVARIGRLADAIGTGPGGEDSALVRQMGLAWLDLKARQVVSDPYHLYYAHISDGHGGIIPDDPRAKANREFLAEVVTNTLSLAKYSTDVLTGYGSILALPAGTGLVSGFDRLDASRSVRDFAQGALWSTDPATQRVFENLDTAGGFVLQYLEIGFDKTAGLKNPLGIVHDRIVADPNSASGYIALGSALAAGSVTAEISTSVLGVPGLALTALNLGSKIALHFLAVDSMTAKLGGSAGQGQVVGTFKILGGTASLLSDTMFNISQAGANYATTTAYGHALELGDALKHGDAAGIAAGIAELGMDYFVLETGYDPRLIGQVGQDFGILVFHLFTGDTAALKDDITKLGHHFLDVFAKNIYFGAIGDAAVAYAGVINDALKDIGEGYRILGRDIVTGALYVGTKIDEAGHVLRDLARTAGQEIVNATHTVLHGVGLDGYIAGATVFVDANFNGTLDPGESAAITDATGHYTLVGANGPIILFGGIDTATRLPTSGTMVAPAGSSTVSALTTLAQNIAARGDGDAAAAQAQLAVALGLPADTDLAHLDPIANVQNGLAGAGQIYAATLAVANTAALLRAAGAGGDPLDAIAGLVRDAGSGAALDLKNGATLAALTGALGIVGAGADAAVQLIAASNTLLSQKLGSITDPASLLAALTAVAISAQGDTAKALAAAGGDPAALAAVLASFTGDGLAHLVDAHVKDVGDIFLTDTHKWLFDDSSHNASSQSGQVFAFYHGLLGRAPDADGNHTYVEALKAGFSLHDLAQALLDSPEFVGKNGDMAQLGAADFVQTLYHTILHRDPDGAGALHYEAALAGGQSRADVASEIVTSPEHLSMIHGAHDIAAPGGEVFALYDAVFGRAPDTLGFESNTDALETRMSLSELAKQFLDSPEYAVTFGHPSDHDFVEQLYATALHRAPDPGGLATYETALAQGTSRADVAVAVATSDEHAGLLDGSFAAGLFVPDAKSADTARLYYGLLDRAPDQDGFIHYRTAALQGNSLQDMAHSILDSSEYNAKFGGLDDEHFIGAVYQGALGRDAEPTGLAFYLAEMRAGTARQDIAVEISTSLEARQHHLADIENGWHVL